MPIELIILGAAMVVFVGGHFALSHPLRGAVIAVLGEQGFRIAYAVVAAASLAMAATAYRYAPRDPVLWAPGAVPQVVYDLLTGLALVLLAGSVRGNPALMAPVSAGKTHRSGGRERQLGHLPQGVFEITRHPMMFAFALWSLAECQLAPNARDLVFFGGLAVLAVCGARAQDRKLARLIGQPWVTWMERTAFWPDLRRIAAPGPLWLLALLVWLGLTWVHTYPLHAPVGVWLADPSLSG